MTNAHQAKDDSPGFADELAQAWHSLDLDPADIRAKRMVAALLRRDPALASNARRADLERLLRDPDVDPTSLAAAGWALLVNAGTIERDGDPATMAASLEDEPLALTLLDEAFVLSLDAELALSSARRWLLLSDRYVRHPRLARALVAQAALNGGAWPFDEEERAALARGAAGSFAAAYLPARPTLPLSDCFNHAVTRDVADQYVRWPYPVWSRITLPEPVTLPRYIGRLDGGCPSGLPEQADMLVAGCGTGREAARITRRFPDAHVTAIDLSSSSLAYAAERCSGLGIDFRLLDLNAVADLAKRFDFIACSGVLHHLLDPESGWSKLVETLKPGGVMKIMLYSRLGRLPVEAAKLHIADLREQPVDDDLLRAVRRRLIERCPDFVAGYSDFYSLGGTHDLLLNRHEDVFDVPRIARTLDDLGLELLAFELPSDADKALYRTEHPEDPLFRDTKGWATFEQRHPFVFSGMYEFWCRKPG